MNRISFFALCVSIICAAGCGLESPFASDTHRARNGVLDLRDSSLKEHELKGEWRFRWKRLPDPAMVPAPGKSERFLKMPGNWDSFHRGARAYPSRGFASMSLTVLLPPDAGRLALRIPLVWTAHRLYVDGRLMGGAGVVAVDAKGAVPMLRPYTVAVPNPGERLEIMLVISNFHHRKGGIQEPLRLGRAGRITRRRERALALDLLLAGCALLLGLYHLTLHTFLRRRIGAPRLFFLFALVVAARTLLKGEQAIQLFVPELPFEYLLRGEFLLLPAALALLSAYLRILFPSEIPGWAPRLVFAASAADIIFNLAAPIYIMSFSTTFYVPFILLTGGGYLYFLILAALRRRRGAVYILPGYVVYFLLVVNDIMWEMNASPLGDASTWGLVIFMFSNSIYFSICFARTFAAVQRLMRSGRRLLHDNIRYSRELEERVRERTRQLRDLRMEAERILHHDLKDPAAGIISTADLLLADERAPADRRLLENIHHGGRRMMAMIRQSLAVFRSGTHASVEDMPGPVDLKRLLARLRERFAYLLRERELTVDLPPDGDAREIHGIERLLESMLGNLLKNALEAAPRGTEVRVAVREHENLVLEIHNQGILPVSLRDDFLEKQLHSDKLHGNGMGAYGARLVARLHGGDIHYSSSREAGTLITVELPAEHLHPELQH